MIKPWIFEFFGVPAEFYERFDAAGSLNYFEAYLDLWASAEPAGFEGIFSASTISAPGTRRRRTC